MAWTGTTLLLLCAMKLCGGSGVKLQALLLLAPEGVNGQCHIRPLYPREETPVPIE